MMKNVLKEIKLGFQLIQYGFQMKANVIMVLFFLMIGIVMEFAFDGITIHGGMLILICGIVPMQMICSIGVSDIGKISPKRKRMETRIGTFCTTILTLAAYLILVMVKGFLYFNNPDQAGFISNQLLLTAITGAIFLIYSGLVYKHFVISMIVLIVAMMVMGVYNSLSMLVLNYDEEIMEITMAAQEGVYALPYAISAVLGAVIILLGGVICWLLTKVFYRHEMSKMAFGAALKKAMQ